MRKEYEFELITEKIVTYQQVSGLVGVKVTHINQVDRSSILNCVVQSNSLKEAVLSATKTIETRLNVKVVGLARMDLACQADLAKYSQISRQSLAERKKAWGLGAPIGTDINGRVFYSLARFFSDPPGKWTNTDLSGLEEAEEVENLRLWFTNRNRKTPISKSIEELNTLYLRA